MRNFNAQNHFLTFLHLLALLEQEACNNFLDIHKQKFVHIYFYLSII